MDNAQREELLSALDAIDVSQLNRKEWFNLGSACFHEKLPLSAWEEISRRDYKRYKPGECERIWTHDFKEVKKPRTKRTIFQMAKRFGWKNKGQEIPWDGTISQDGDSGGNGHETVPVWNPVEDLTAFLKTIFKPDDFVGYATTDAFQDDDGKWHPLAGVYSRTCQQLIDSLQENPDDIALTVGDWHPEAGAWIHLNPMDGTGVKDENCTAFNYVLVESDSMTIADQRAIYDQLRLPIATLVRSGDRSLHGLVHIDAANQDEYDERVNYLFDCLAENGMEIDEANKNPGRKTRMPGVTRNGEHQCLVATNIGCSSWTEWKNFIENDYVAPEKSSILDLFNSLDTFDEVEADWLIPGWIPADQITLISADGGTGKTSLWINLLAGLSSGRKTIFDIAEESEVNHG